ncbi:hypothetical protein [Brevundimonas denitrificans]|uniref:hypothetical protein n=1 Tax=Brevundimonas denitrificans TaxID=1443434 RepID=UPI00223BAEE3|nr:hypothetical protein [Brevundimonas denitrificans]
MQAQQGVEPFQLSHIAAKLALAGVRIDDEMLALGAQPVRPDGCRREDQAENQSDHRQAVQTTEVEPGNHYRAPAQLFGQG